jgi:sensor histidine kinase YesM
MIPSPILKNYKTRLLYISLWTAVSVVQVIFLGTKVKAADLMPYFVADIFLFNAPLALLLIYAWIPINVIKWSGTRWFSYLTAHLIMSLGFAMVSLCINKIIMWIIAGSNAAYWQFLERIFYGARFMMCMISYLVVILTYYLYIFIKRYQEKQLNEIRLNQIIKTNELNLLKSQINPHFLFNSLNSLNSLIMSNSEQAQKMLLALSDYLRYTVLSNNNPYSTLQQEIANSERYLAIEKLRFGKRLVYQFNILHDCLQAQIPSMLLQPLFENAVKYNVYESLQQVVISADATINGNILSIVIANTYDSQQSSMKKGTGTGLSNIRERLHLSYEDDAGLSTQIKDGKFIVMLWLPMK